MNTTLINVIVYLRGRNRTRVAHALRTDADGRLWARVESFGRTRWRVVTALA